jgi:uncharacterized phage-associated protein
MHRGHFKLQSGFFKKHAKSKLDADEKDVIDRVMKYYGKRDPHWLSQLTHLEDPWKIARTRSCSKNEDTSSEEISHQDMFEYYSAL